MRKVGRDVEREAVEGHPALNAHAQSADFGLIRTGSDPNTDPSVGAVGGNAELGERVDHPAFERMNEAADVLSALFEVEHHIADALTGTVIGVAAAAAGLEHGDILGVQKLGGVGAGAGGEQGGMLE